MTTSEKAKSLVDQIIEIDKRIEKMISESTLAEPKKSLKIAKNSKTSEKEAKNGNAKSQKKSKG
jgi:hypothetical protein